MTKKVSLTKILLIVLSILIIVSVLIPVIAYNSARKQLPNDIPGKVHDLVEEYFKVTNKASINVNYVSEESKLNVLEVSDLVYIQKDKKENDANADVLYKAIGFGIFSIDLNMAEIIVDEERNLIEVRIQEPKLECSADGFSELYYKDGIFTTKKQANELSIELQNEALKAIRVKISGNENYYLLARDNAKKDIENLFKRLNPKNKDLKVLVDFMDW